MAEALCTITPSPPRRIFGALVLVALGAILIRLGLGAAPLWLALRLGLIVLGVGALMLCAALWRATGAGLALYPDRIADTAGHDLLRIADVAGVERGAFAFKPSNGFLLRLKTPQPRAWAPGLWWRLGRKMGVGGVISGSEGRQMAEAISALLARADAAPAGPPDQIDGASGGTSG